MHYWRSAYPVHSYSLFQICYVIIILKVLLFLYSFSFCSLPLILSVSLNWVVVGGGVAVIVVVLAFVIVVVGAAVMLALSSTSAPFCHMSNWIANLVRENPAAAIRLNNFLLDFLCSHLAAVGYSLSKLAINFDM
jgi:vacuolar-type H+-ATPase subunit I/STV1